MKRLFLLMVLAFSLGATRASGQTVALDTLEAVSGPGALPLGLPPEVPLPTRIAAPVRPRTALDAYEGQIQTGISAVYNLELDRAEVIFSAIERAAPREPIGPFFLAMVDWWRIRLDLDNTSLDDRFYNRLDRVVKLCDAKLRANPNDADALFFKGGAYGFRGQLRIYRDQWVRAAQDGRRALDVVEQAKKVAPNNTDLMFGLGIYNYYAATTPVKYPYVKPFMLFFPKGNREVGLEQLTIAARQGRFARTEAMFSLAQLYFTYEEEFTTNPTDVYRKALACTQQLVQAYPRNAIFQSYLGRAYFKLGRTGEMVAVYDTVVARAGRRETGYTAKAERDARYYLGATAIGAGNAELARLHLERSLTLTRAMPASEQRNNWSITTLLRLGNIADWQGDRPRAEALYNEVLGLKDYNKTQDQARAYLQTPYRR